jgi:uncharacterized protein (DUF1778 family)
MTGSRRSTLNIRIQPADRALIDRAASLLGKSPADFVLEAACVAAKNMLMDRTVFALNPKAHAEFLVRLSARPMPNRRLRRSLQRAAPWD